MIEEPVPTALGCWLVYHDSGHLHRLSWLGWEGVGKQSSLSLFASQIQDTINAYAKTGILNQTIIPLRTQVSQFQSRVLEQLGKIPYGSTKTYGDIAQILNSSPRAIGQACRSNPIPLFIPCHRVVSKSGLGGFMGKQNQLDLKSFLLNLEVKTRNDCPPAPNTVLVERS